MTSRRSRSQVWKFFVAQHNNSALCLTCGKDYSRKGRGTTSLRNHLKAMHKEQFKILEAEERKKLEEEENIRNAHLLEMKSDIEERDVEEENLHETEETSDDFNYESEIMDKCVTEMLVMDDSPSSRLDKSVAEMLLMDVLPFSHVEDTGFTRLMAEAAPQYKVKQPSFYSSLICNDMFGSVFNEIKGVIDAVKKDSGKVSFTATLCSGSSSTGVSLLSVTAHFINSDFERGRFVLGAEPLQQRRTSQDICTKFKELLMKWDMRSVDVHCVVCDAEASLKKALFLSGVNNLDCFVNQMQQLVKTGMSSQDEILEIIEKCHNIAIHFHESVTARDALSKIQDRLQQPKLCVILDTPTSWTTTLHMLQRTLDIKESLCLYAANNSNIQQLTAIQWLIMSTCTEALQPYEDITQRLSDSTCTVADVMPLVVCLLNTLGPNTSLVSEVTSASSLLSEPGAATTMSESPQRREATHTRIVNNMKQTMRAEVEKMLSKLESEDLYRVATYLDPRYKSKFFSSRHVTEQVKSSVARICEEMNQLSTKANQSQAHQPARKRRRANKTQTSRTYGTLLDAMTSILASSSDDDEEEETHIARKNARQHIECYHKDKRLKGTNGEDSLRWWNERRNVYPDLAKVACRYLSCPQSSGHNEQTFRVPGFTQQAKLTQPLPRNAGKLLFLKENLPILNFKY